MGSRTLAPMKQNYWQDWYALLDNRWHIGKWVSFLALPISSPPQPH